MTVSSVLRTARHPKEAGTRQDSLRPRARSNRSPSWPDTRGRGRAVLVLRRPCSDQIRLLRGRDPSENACVFGGTGAGRVPVASVSNEARGSQSARASPSRRASAFLVPFGAQPKGTRRHGSTKSGVGARRCFCNPGPELESLNLGSIYSRERVLTVEALA